MPWYNLYQKAGIKTFKNIIAVIIYLVLTIIITYPGILHFNSSIIGDGGDGLEYFSYFYTVKNALIKGIFPFGHTDLYRYPKGVDTMISEAKIFSLAGGLLSLFLNSIVVYNLLVYLFFILNAYLSFLFYGSLTGNYQLSLLGGLLNGFSVWTIVNGYGGINAFLVFGFPVLGLAVVDLVQYNKAINYYFVTAGFCLLAACSAVWLIMGLIGTLSVFLVFLVVDKKSITSLVLRIKKQVKHAFIAAALAVLFWAVYFGNYMIIIYNSKNNADVYVHTPSPITPQAFIVPPSSYYQSLLAKTLSYHGINLPANNWWHGPLYVGVPVMLGMVLAVFVLKKHKLLQVFYINSVFYALLTVVGIVFLPHLKQGIFNWMVYPLYYINYQHFYFLTLFWFFITGTLVLVLKIINVKKISVLALFFILIFERLNTGYPTTEISFFDGASYADKVKSLPGKAVLDLPLISLPLYNLLPFRYGKPIVGGQIHWLADSVNDLSLAKKAELERFYCYFTPGTQEMNNNKEMVSNQKQQVLKELTVSLLKKSGVNTVVLHKHWLYKEKCRFARMNVAFLFSDISFKESGLDKEDYLYIRSASSGNENRYFIRTYEDKDVIIYQLSDKRVSKT